MPPLVVRILQYVRDNEECDALDIAEEFGIELDVVGEIVQELLDQGRLVHATPDSEAHAD